MHARTVGIPAAALGLSKVASGQAGTLTYRHPEYERRWWYWELGRVSYVGGREYREPNLISVQFDWPKQLDTSTRVEIVKATYPSLLHRHRREDDADYANRRRRAFYFNFVAPIVNGLIAHATKKSAIREGDEAITEWWEGVDEARECGIGQFMNYGATWAQNYGVMWACVDNDIAGDGSPYAYWVPPLDIWDWAVKDGEIAWLKQFVCTEADRPTWRAQYEPGLRFRVWYPDRVETWACDREGNGEKLLEERGHSAGCVPLVPLFSQRSQDYTFPDGNPIAGDLALVANSVYQDCSMLQEILGEQTFSQMVIPDPGGKLDKLQISLHRFLSYDPQGAGGAPAYLSPDVNQPKVLMEAIAMKLATARQAIGVGRGRQEGSMQQASAESLELESDDKKAVLSMIAGEMEDFEERLADLFYAYSGKPAPEDVSIRYPREFDLRSLQAEIMEATSLQGLGMPEPVMRQAKADIIERKWQSMAKEELEELQASLDIPEQNKDARTEGDPSQSGDGNPGPQGDKTATEADDSGKEDE